MPQYQAAVFCGPEKPLEIRHYETSTPIPGYARLNLAYSGICGTDVHICRGRLGMVDYPLIIGHEFTGTIAEMGSDGFDALGTALHVGDQAIACVAIPCGKCFNCLRGESASCLAFGVTYVKPVDTPPHFHGGFAETLYSPLGNLVRIPEGIDLRAAAAFPCGGPTVIRAFAYAGMVETGSVVVIQGNGALGIFALAYAKSLGCHCVVIGGSGESRMAMVNAIGCDLFLDRKTTTEAERREAVLNLAKSLNRGDGADAVIEVSGAADAFPEGLQLLRTRGKYLIPGQYSNRGGVTIHPELITFRALQLFGSGQYTFADIGTYLEFLKAQPELQKIFAECVHTYPVADANDALAAAALGHAVKVAFAPTR